MVKAQFRDIVELFATAEEALRDYSREEYAQWIFDTEMIVREALKIML